MAQEPFFFVARGPVPRDGSRDVIFTVGRGPSDAIRACERVSPAIIGVHERWRGTGPRPTVRVAFFYRSAGACPPRWLKRCYFHRSAGACPPRSLERANAGEGQALALRWRGVFFRSAGACPQRCLLSSYVFRSFRTYMSIETRVVPFSRSFRSLIKHARTWQKLLRT